MTDESPPLALRHVALNVTDLPTVERFYVHVLGMRVEWRPDADNVYLTLGSDNIALHRAHDLVSGKGALDHIGFLVAEPGHVDDWAVRLRANGIELAAEPKTHRDGARSLYVRDPAGNLVQIIYHPPIAGTL